MKALLYPDEIAAALAQPKKPEVLAEQKLDARYHVEHPELEDRPRKFLEAFAAILRHTHYGPALDHCSRLVNHCGRCAVECMIYQATGDPRDIPCQRSGLLLDVYRRYFTISGRLKARGGDVLLIDGNRDDVAVAFKHHTDKLGGDSSCAKCHHANVPKDKDSGCCECHSDTYLASSIFNHDLHAKLEGGNAGCVECHPISG